WWGHPAIVELAVCVLPGFPQRRGLVEHHPTVEVDDEGAVTAHDDPVVTTDHDRDVLLVAERFVEKLKGPLFGAVHGFKAKHGRGRGRVDDEHRVPPWRHVRKALWPQPLGAHLTREHVPTLQRRAQLGPVTLVTHREALLEAVDRTFGGHGLVGQQPAQGPLVLLCPDAPPLCARSDVERDSSAGIRGEQERVVDDDWIDPARAQVDLPRVVRGALEARSKRSLALQEVVPCLDGGSLACPCHEVRASHDEGDDGERPRATDPVPSRSLLRGTTLAGELCAGLRAVVVLERSVLESSVLERTGLDELDLLLAPSSRHDSQAIRRRRAARASRRPAPEGALRPRAAPTRRSAARRSTAARPSAPR